MFKWKPPRIYLLCIINKDFLLFTDSDSEPFGMWVSGWEYICSDYVKKIIVSQ